MSNLGNDIKSGLKGIFGAGEALRGTVNEAADQALDTDVKHPAAQQSQLKNRSVAEKGKADIAGADNMIARHEAKHQGTGAPVQSQPVEGNHAFSGGATGTSGTY
jgi:outer membrane murein-binding lipoprotein Lpp